MAGPRYAGLLGWLCWSQWQRNEWVQCSLARWLTCSLHESNLGCNDSYWFPSPPLPWREPSGVAGLILCVLNATDLLRAVLLLQYHCLSVDYLCTVSPVSSSYHILYADKISACHFLKMYTRRFSVLSLVWWGLIYRYIFVRGLILQDER